MPRTGSLGWHLEIDHPDGTTLRPDLLDDVSRSPAVNGFPTAELPVAEDPTWHSDAFDDAPLRLWEDGRRQPLDQLEHRRLTPDRTVLEARGGVQLDRRIIEEVDIEPTHELLERLITERTDYQASVDTPEAGAETDVLIQEAAADFELQTALEEIPATVPAAIVDDTLLPLQASWAIDAADESGPEGTGREVASPLDQNGRKRIRWGGRRLAVGWRFAETQRPFAVHCERPARSGLAVGRPFDSPGAIREP